jgi:hypothetical protein
MFVLLRKVHAGAARDLLRRNAHGAHARARQARTTGIGRRTS